MLLVVKLTMVMPGMLLCKGIDTKVNSNAVVLYTLYHNACINSPQCQCSTTNTPLISLMIAADLTYSAACDPCRCT